jgi:mono/diheme cytochrome c family protein
MKTPSMIGQTGNRAPQRENAAGWMRSAGSLLAAIVLACGGGEQEPSRSETASAPAPAVPSEAVSGAELYQRWQCVTCHQPDGQGLPGLYPPLAGSEYATAADPAAPIRILLNGIQGPLTVRGARYDGIMPPYGIGVEMSDNQVAAVLTYVRQSWGNRASAITPQDVARERGAPRSVTGPVTAEELRGLIPR